MDTMVETPLSQQAPIGEQSRSTSPAGSRKRGFEEVDAVTVDNGRDAAIGQENTVQEVSKLNAEENICPGPMTGVTMNVAEAPTTVSINTTANTITTQNGTTGAIAPNTNATANPIAASTPALPLAPTTPKAAPTMPNKKVKLSPASLEAKRIEKEIRDRQRAEERAKKEEERRVREEEKKKRDEEREEERKKKEERKKVKEEERLAREEEKKKKEEEKLKKERSQMRLNAFFTKPAASSAAAVNPARAGNVDPTRADRNDASPPCNGNGAGNRKSSEPTAGAKVISDYGRDFPDFYLQSHTNLAPIHRFERDEEALRHLRENVDGHFKKASAGTSSIEAKPFQPTELFHIMPYRRLRGKQRLPTVKEILIKMQGSTSNPIDLTGEQGVAKSNPKPEDILRKIPVKSLKYSEDVRPPYQGTFTRSIPERSALQISRNPFKRAMPGINYDYDSEAEWEEPEEGEDLDSEGEEELSDDGDEDMDGFLDDGDEEQTNGKRKLIVGDLEPICTGLRWEDEAGADPDLSKYRMEIISDLPRFKFPIDPFSSSYWKPIRSNAAAMKSTIFASNLPLDKTGKLSRDMHPPPAPQCDGAADPNTLNLQTFSSTPKTHLSRVNPNGSHTLVFNSKPQTDINAKPKRPFPSDKLAELKEIVEGSNLTKTGLVEVVKKRFPKVPKGVLRDTLNDVAVRVGEKEVDKKWVLKS